MLRYGIPPVFYMGILQPNKGQDKKIQDKMLRTFSEAHLAEMYGAKEDAQDEDFFPYVLVPLTSPQFLQ